MGQGPEAAAVTRGGSRRQATVGLRWQEAATKAEMLGRNSVDIFIEKNFKRKKLLS